METSNRMADQIKVEEGCRLSTARRVVMIEAFAMAGKDIDYAAQSLRLKKETIRKYIKKFNIIYPGVS